MPDIGLDSGFDLPFKEQVDFFRNKLTLGTRTWLDIEREAHDRAFVVAGAMKADLLADLRRAVDRAITQGTSLKAFREDFRQIVFNRGWTGWTGEGTAAGEAWRTKVIWETNLRSSYAAGRWAQLNDPGLKKLMPYWRYVHADSVMSPRPQHLAWGQSRLTLPSDHPFWKTHFPPNGWGCRCRVTAVAAPKPGDATEPPDGWDEPDDKGNLPGIDKGWDYAPGASVASGLKTLVNAKVKGLPPEIGKGLAEDVAGMANKAAYWDSSTPAGQWHDAAFANAPDYILTAIKKAGDPAVISAKMPPHFDPASQTIQMGKLTKASLRTQGTWRHEYGHFVDNALRNKASGDRYFSSENGFVDAMRRDLKPLLENGAYKYSDQAKKNAAAYAASEARFMAAGEGREDWLAKHYAEIGLDYDAAKSCMRKHALFPSRSSETEKQSRYRKIADAIAARDAQTMMDAMSGGPGNFAEAVETFKKGDLGKLADLVGSLTNNRVSGFKRSGAGHPDAYYKKSFDRAGTEVFANLFCLHGEGSLFFRQVLELLVPETSKAFLEAIK